MRTALSRVTAIAVGTAVALLAPAALAQDTPPPTPTQPPPEPPPPPRPQVTTTVQAPATGLAPGGNAKAAEEKDEGISDHEKVIGHLAVGYLGLTTLPIAGGGGIPDTVNAPVVGVRYWFAERIGLDVGLGFGLSSGSTESVTGAQTVTTDRPSVFGMALHGGVPLVFAHVKHFKFLTVPELNIGFARATEQPAGGAPGAQPPEVSHSGFHLDVGARIGSEIHFGFIGVPQLSLQATIGLFGRIDNRKASSEVNGVTNSVSSSSSGFGTSVQSDPWAIFANNISALYYFP